MSPGQNIEAHRLPERQVAESWCRLMPDARLVMNPPVLDRAKDFRLFHRHGMEVCYEVKCDWKSADSGNLFLERQSLDHTRADVWLHYTPTMGLWTFAPRRMRQWLRDKVLWFREAVGDGNVDGWVVPAKAARKQEWIGLWPAFRISTDKKVLARWGEDVRKVVA